MTEEKTVVVELTIDGKGMTVRTEGATFALADEELWQIREEARQAVAGGDLAALGDMLWRATLGRCALGLAEGSRIVLVIDEPAEPAELADLPWECMVEPEMGLPVALHPAFSVSRKPAGGKPPRADREPHPAHLRILFVHPGGGLPFAAAQDRSQEELAERGLADPLSVIGGGEAPVDALERRSTHIVHWIVGSPEDGGIEAVVRCLIGLPAVPPLLVLTGADGAALPEGSLLARLLSRLSRVGVEAVLSPWRQDLAPFAAPFWAGLYESLAGGETLATAVRRARQWLDLEGSEAPVWLEPAVRAFRPDTALVTAGEAAGELGSLLGVRGTPAERPFKGLSPYDESDRYSFFGREDEARVVLHRLLDEKRLVLHGASGTGKTSLIRAALVPGLQGPDLQPPLYISRCADPAAEILAALGEPLPAGESPAVDRVLNALDRRLGAAQGLLLPILLDQAEDLVLYPERKELLRGLLERTREGPSRCVLLLALRSDARLWFRNEIDSVYFDRPVSELELRPLTRKRAALMLDHLSRHYSFGFEAGLKERLLADLSASPDPASPGAEPLVLLPQLSLVLEMLYERRQRSPALLLLEEYDHIEIDRLLPDQLRQVQDLLDEPAARMAPQVEIRLVDTTTRRPVARSPAEIAEILGSDVAVVSRVTEALLRRRLAHRLSGGRVQLVHEILARSICDEHLDKDLAEQDAVRGLLRSYLPRWKDAGEPLPPEVLARARLVVRDLDLPLPEFGLYVGSALLSSEQDSFVSSLPHEQIGGLSEEFGRSSHPRLLALGLFLASQCSPLQRRPPISFDSPPELRSSTRFVSEALLPVLARHALGVPDQQDEVPDRSEIERNRTEALQLLAEPELLRKPISGHSYRVHETLARVLCGEPLNLMTESNLALRFWPGSWISRQALLLAAVLLVFPLSWILWPTRGQEFADLCLLLFVTAALLTACASTVQQSQVLRALGSSLVFSRSSPEVAWVRLRMILRLTAGTLAMASILFSVLNLLALHSSWLHRSFFTADTVHTAWAFIFGLPESAAPLPARVSTSLHDFFLGIPVLGTLLKAVLGFPEGSIGFWWGVSRLVSLILAFFIALLGLLITFCAAAVLPGMLLLPTGLLAVCGCLNSNRVLFSSPGPRVRRIGKVLVISLATGLALPGAALLSHSLLSWMSPFLWHPEAFYGAHGTATLGRLLERFGREPALVALGFLVPVATCILVQWLGCRRVRFILMRGTRELSDSALRPLVAEGTYESLRLMLYLVGKWPAVRGVETFFTLFWMALEDPCVLPAALGEDRVRALADEAEANLSCFDSRFWQTSGLLAFLRQESDMAVASGRAVRARRLLLAAEAREAASEPLPSAFAAAPAQSFGPRNVIASFFAIGFGTTLLFLAVHSLRVLGSHLLSATLPLNASIVVPLTDIKGTLAWGVRLIEITTFGLLVLLPILAMIALPQVLKKLRHRFQAGRRP